MVTRRLGARKGEKMSNWTISRVLKVKHGWAWWEIGWVTDRGDSCQSFFFFLFLIFFILLNHCIRTKNIFFSFSPKNIDFRPDLPRNLPFLRCVPQMYDFSVQGGVFDVQPWNLTPYMTGLSGSLYKNFQSLTWKLPTLARYFRFYWLDRQLSRYLGFSLAQGRVFDIQPWNLSRDTTGLSGSQFQNFQSLTWKLPILGRFFRFFFRYRQLSRYLGFSLAEGRVFHIRPWNLPAQTTGLSGRLTVAILFHPTHTRQTQPPFWLFDFI